jgi:hypothetical protein
MCGIGGVLVVIEKGLRGSSGSGRKPRGRFGEGMAMAGGGRRRLGCSRERSPSGFYSRAKQGECVACASRRGRSRSGARYGRGTTKGATMCGRRRGQWHKMVRPPTHGNVPCGTGQGPRDVMHRELGTAHGPLGTMGPRRC